MTIEDLVNRTCEIHPCPRLSESPIRVLKYENAALRQKIDFMQTFSTSFFPKLITNLKNNEKCIVWDNHFWDLYKRFLFAILNIQNYDMSSSIAYDFFISLYTIFLSTRFYKRPILSLIFAKRYASTGFFIPPYHLKDNDVEINIGLRGFSDFLDYSKDFVFFHEIHHARYQSDNMEKLENFRLILDACETLKKFSSLPKETKDEIDKLINLNDTTLLEELCCDVNSILTITYLNSVDNKPYDKTIAENVIRSQRIISLFIQNLKSIDTVYKKRCDTDNWDEIKAYADGFNYTEREVRNYIVHFIASYLMGFANTGLDTNLDFLTKDELFYIFYRPYNDILSHSYQVYLKK